MSFCYAAVVSSDDDGRTMLDFGRVLHENDKPEILRQ